MKPVSSSNDVAMDALDFDRMKQVSENGLLHLRGVTSYPFSPMHALYEQNSCSVF